MAVPANVEDVGPAIAIDLGSTYACVGVWHNNWVEIIANEQGSRKTPSFVAFRDGEQLVGDAATNQAAMNTRNTVYDLKRLIGRRFSEASVQSNLEVWPFTVTPGPREMPLITVVLSGEERRYAAEEICAILLARMKEIAEDFLQCEVTRCVITVPGNFSMAQREATANAGWIAGLNVLRVVNESTAAAFAYALHRESAMAGEEWNVLIFDLGGGTLSVSVVIIEDGIVEVKAMAGDSHLGGTDFDARMVAHFAREFKTTKGKDISSSPRALRKLEAACERAKRSLSVSNKSIIDIDALFDGIDFISTITRAEFEELNMDLFDKCLVPVQTCLDDSGISKKDIDNVVLVGGSSRIPKVRELLQNFFDGKELCKSHVNPDEAVAFGAGVLAAIIGGDVSEKLVSLMSYDVTPKSLGLEIAGGAMYAMIPRNTPLPARKSIEFFTFPNYQTCVLLEVYEGEEERAIDNELVATYELRDLPPAPQGGLVVIVSFEVDANGFLSVTAKSSDGEKIVCGQRLSSTPLYPVVTAA